MVILNRVLDDAKVRANRPANRALERNVERLDTKARKTAHRAHRDVQRIPVLVRGTLAMAHVRKRFRLRPRTLLRLPSERQLPPVLEGHLNRSAVDASLAHNQQGDST